jgi:two-component system OmpR family sensor kinase
MSPDDPELVTQQGKLHSLRLRLVLWYGALLALALLCFAALILVLTMSFINQSVESEVRVQARIASLAVYRKLSPLPPYWPTHLMLSTIDTFRGPGVVVEIVDTHRKIRYLSANDPSINIPLNAKTMQTILSSNSPAWYTATVESQQVRVEALPIGIPILNTNNVTVNQDGTLSKVGHPIGILLVAKSLSDTEATLFLLQILLLLSGLVTLAGALISSWIIASRVLHPLSGIVSTARAIATSTARGTRIGNLSQRVRRPGGHDELVQVVDTFNEMLASLESATQVQRRFIADASHELRAPLTTIQGNLAFLQSHLDDLPPREARTMLTDAQAETIRLVGLVEQLLLLARADAKIDTSLQAQQLEEASEKIARHTLPIELDRIVLQLVRQLRGRMSVEGSKVKLEVGRIEPLHVPGDEESMRRVILILLDNALKYTAASDTAGKGHVIISLEHNEQQAILRISDTGIGIEPADLPHIFERFYRADRARPRQGTGLGLSIAQVLVEQLGGHITATSTPGKGSTFSVIFPLMKEP